MYNYLFIYNQMSICRQVLHRSFRSTHIVLEGSAHFCGTYLKVERSTLTLPCWDLKKTIAKKDIVFFLCTLKIGFEMPFILSSVDTKHTCEDFDVWPYAVHIVLQVWTFLLKCPSPHTSTGHRSAFPHSLLAFHHHNLLGSLKQCPLVRVDLIDIESLCCTASTLTPFTYRVFLCAYNEAKMVCQVSVTCTTSHNFV